MKPNFSLKRTWQWAALIAICLAILVIPQTNVTATPVERSFHIQARRFEYSPAILQVNPGDRVTIELTAMDVVHGISIDGYGLTASADPGKTTQVTFIADKPGLFHFHCSVTCGNMHPFMTGKLQVGSNSMLWRAMGIIGIACFAMVWMTRK